MQNMQSRLASVVRRTATQTAQAAAQQVKQQSIETVKSAAQQIAPELVSANPDRGQDVSNLAGQAAAGELNAQQINQQAEVKLNSLRKRLGEIQNSEQQKVRQGIEEQQQAWAKQQQEQLQQEQHLEENPTTFVGKVKKKVGGMVQGAKKRMSQVTGKSEKGRGAKN